MRSLKKLSEPLPENTAVSPFIRIVIPAHNEALVVGYLLESIRLQLYPADKFETWVIADNCSDNTAKIAQQFETICLERNTGKPSSKGEALQYASQILESQGKTEGYTILIDADCQLEPGYLREVAKKLQQVGCGEIIQTYRYVINRNSFIVSTLDSASEAIRQWITLGSRKICGVSSFILGSGVVFKTALFIRLTSSNKGGLVEDKHWNAELLLEGKKIDWCPSARLNYEVVENNTDFQKQRKRWINGQFELAKEYFFKMFFNGIKTGNLSQIDFSISLIQLPRSALMIFTLLLTIGSYFMGSTFLPYWVYILLFVSLILYGFLGLLLIHAEKKYYFKMLFGSIIILGLTRSTISSLLGRKEKKWNPTSRATAMTKK